MGDLISRTAVLEYLQERQANVIKEKHSKSRTLSYDTIRGMEATAEAFMNFVVQMPVYDMDKIIDQLEELREPDTCPDDVFFTDCAVTECTICKVDKAIRIIEECGV